MRKCYCFCKKSQTCCIKTENMWKWLLREIVSHYFYWFFLSPSSLTHYAFSTTSYCWERFQKSWTGSKDLKSWHRVKPSEQEGTKQCRKCSSSCGVVDSLLLSETKTTFSSSHTGLSLPQSTNNKQLSSKKLILYQKKSPWKIYALIN